MYLAIIILPLIKVSPAPPPPVVNCACVAGALVIMLAIDISSCDFVYFAETVLESVIDLLS